MGLEGWVDSGKREEGKMKNRGTTLTSELDHSFSGITAFDPFYFIDKETE